MLALLALFACSEPAPTPKPAAPPAAPPAPPAAPVVDPGVLKLFGTPPAAMTADGNPPPAALVDLGRALYFDTRMSKNHDLSCNSCHGLNTYGVDNKPTSTGHKGQLGGRNSPTVYNAAGHIAQFWDGRAADVEAQAKGPVLNPVEMGMPDAASVERVIVSIPGYKPMFEAAFPGEPKPITYDNIAKAIGAFERGLTTPAPFDKLLAGDGTALTDQQKKGLNTFVETGCTTCHSGAYVGGAMYQKLGLVTAWPDSSDLGRFDVTQSETDKLVFKVPSLRNVAKTAPYFHNGKVATLPEAITLMGKHQLGKDLTAEQVQDIEAFLGSLTGELPTAYIQAPTLPESGPKTPKPDPT